jgi:murein DD-endopeptidase MepM/ murein hydrolase activator NlpD
VYSGPVNQLSSYAYYGVNIYCAGPGKVVEVVRDLPDEIPGATPSDITVLTAVGNHVIVQMAGKRYAMYAHLVPNSVTVQLGDSVETGQVLGKLGNSGSSSVPHLHFQVMDAPSPLTRTGCLLCSTIWADATFFREAWMRKRGRRSPASR